MKISKFLGAVAAIALTLTAMGAAPANAEECRIGSDGVVIVPDSGQCTISMPPFVDPNAGSNPSPSASPSDMPSSGGGGTSPVVNQPTPTPTPSATPSATPTPTPVATPAPVKVPLVKHVVRAVTETLNAFAIKRIYIVDTVDSSFYTECWYATYCALDAPKGHTWRFNILSDYDFWCGLDGEGMNLTDGLPRVATLNNEYSASLVSKQTGATEVLFSPLGSPLKLLSRGVADVEISFGAVTKDAKQELSFEQGDPVTIYQLVKTYKKIGWTNLPPGLVEAADGTITGTPTTAGRYVIRGAFGGTRTPYYYQLPINIAGGLNTPTAVVSSWSDLTTAKLAYSATVTSEAKTIPDFFEIEVTNMRTGAISNKYFDGTSRAGIIRDLLPGDDHRIRVRSAKASSVPKYSAFSEPFTLKGQLPPQYFTADSDTVKLVQTWAPGSSTKIAVTIPNKKNGQIQITFSKKTLRVNYAQAGTFNVFYDGLFMKPSGEINGTITEKDLKKKPLNIRLGSVDFVFTPEVKK